MMPRKLPHSGHPFPGPTAIAAPRMRLRCACAALLLASALPLHAATRSWTGTASADWATAGNWLGGSVPAAGDSVSIDAIAPNKTVFASGASSIGTITVGSAGAGVVSGDLTITGGGQLSAAQVWAGQGVNGSGVVSVSNASRLGMSGNFYVADSGAGTLLISTGGGVNDANGYVGYSANSIGQVGVAGANSSWVNSNLLSIGSAGLGILQVIAGGTVSNDTAYLGGSTAPGAGGSALVIDPGSLWSTGGELRVGDSGAASLDIANGGTVTDATGTAGYQAGSQAAVTVDGAGSTWTNGADLFVGRSGRGTLTISHGALVQSAATIVAEGIGTAGSGQIVVDGAGSRLTQATLIVGYDGDAQLIVRNGGDVSVVGAPLYIATNSNSTSIVAIGSAPAAPAQAPGTISASNIHFGGVIGGGNGTVVFNHTSANYAFAQTLVSGAAPGTIEALAGTTSLTADSSAFAGDTLIAGGSLRIDGKLGPGTVTVTGGMLGGSGTIAGPVSVQSGGHVAPGNSPGTLTLGALTLAAGAALDFELAMPGTIGGGVNDLLVVNGNLALNGSLNIADAGGFGSGTYRLIDYTGRLSGTLALGSLPSGFNSSQMQIDVSTPGQVNLVVAAATAPAIGIAPSGLSFGNVGVGSSSSLLSATVNSTGSGPLTVSSISAPSAPFTASGGTCSTSPFALAAGSSCTLIYAFDPAVAGPFNATIVVASDAPSGPASFTLSGVGVTAVQAPAVAAPLLQPWAVLVTIGLLGTCGARARRRRT